MNTVMRFSTYVLLLCIPGLISAEQQRQRIPVSDSKEGTRQRPSPKAVDLTAPQGAPAVPINLPDRYDLGRLSGFNDVHESQIKDLQGRVSSIETNINWGRGLIAGTAAAFIIILAFLKTFWKPIARILFEEASNPKATKIVPPQTPT